MIEAGGASRRSGAARAIATPRDATARLKGALVEAATIKNSDIASHLKLPPVKLHCSMLAEDAIKAAITDYKSKQEASDARVAQRTEMARGGGRRGGREAVDGEIPRAAFS